MNNVWLQKVKDVLCMFSHFLKIPAWAQERMLMIDVSAVCISLTNIVEIRHGFFRASDQRCLGDMYIYLGDRQAGRQAWLVLLPFNKVRHPRWHGRTGWHIHTYMYTHTYMQTHGAERLLLPCWCVLVSGFGSQIWHCPHRMTKSTVRRLNRFYLQLVNVFTHCAFISLQNIICNWTSTCAIGQLLHNIHKP